MPDESESMAEPAMVPVGGDLWEVLGAPTDAEEETWWSNLLLAWLDWHARNLAGYRQRCQCMVCGVTVVLDEPRPHDGKTGSGTPVDAWKVKHYCDPPTSARPHFRTTLVQVGALVKGELATTETSVPVTGDHPGT